MKIRAKIVLLVLFSFVLKYSVFSQPLGCERYISFQIFDKNGLAIYPHHPDFDNYELILRIGSNENNSPDEPLGSYDTIVVGNRDYFSTDNLSTFSFSWINYELPCPNIEFAELVIKHGNDSMYVELTGKINGHFALDNIQYTPGYKYYITTYKPNQEFKAIDKVPENNDLFKANFSDLNWTIVQPIENYIPFLVEPRKIDNKVFLWIKMQGSALGKSNDYIATSLKNVNGQIEIELIDIVIEKNSCYGRMVAGMGEPISKWLNIGILKDGKHKVVVKLGEKKENYLLSVKGNSIEFRSNSINKIMELIEPNTTSPKE